MNKMQTIDWLLILRKFDFCGLDAMGAPSDEYEFEAAKLKEWYSSCRSEKDLADLLYRVLKECRYTLASDDLFEYQEAAQAIWSQFNSNQREEKLPTQYESLHLSAESAGAIEVPPYKVHATLRIYHDDLIPDEITRILDLKPTKTQIKGQPFSKRPKYTAPIGGWFLDSISHVKQKNASNHVEWILDQVAQSSGALRTLKERGYRIDIHIGWFVESNNTCPSLSPAIMRRVGILDIECWFDIYLFPKDDL